MTTTQFNNSIFGAPSSLAAKLYARCACFLRTGYFHTGERCCPEFPNANFLNHLKVYVFARQFCAGKRVLDVGCGTGYGSSHLAEVAESVVGGDISRAAIRYAKRRYVAQNIEFLRLNAETLDLPDKSFDFVISTENFEHLRNQRANIAEMARVLRDDGMLLLATPNHEMFLAVNNRFHTHEVEYEELCSLVGDYFDDFIVTENLLDPLTEEGQRRKHSRKIRNAVGQNLKTNPFLWGHEVDVTHLSNTHSFFCFARRPCHTQIQRFG